MHRNLEGEIEQLQKALIDLHRERERALYWLCSLVEKPTVGSSMTHVKAALESMGYDEARIQSMIRLGEPGKLAPSQRLEVRVLCKRPACNNEMRYTSGYCAICDCTYGDGKGARL